MSSDNCFYGTSTILCATQLIFNLDSFDGARTLSRYVKQMCDWEVPASAAHHLYIVVESNPVGGRGRRVHIACPAIYCCRLCDRTWWSDYLHDTRFHNSAFSRSLVLHLNASDWNIRCTFDAHTEAATTSISAIIINAFFSVSSEIIRKAERE